MAPYTEHFYYVPDNVGNIFFNAVIFLWEYLGLWNSIV